MLTSREIASLILLGALVLVVLLVPKWRRQFRAGAVGILKIIFSSPSLPTLWGLFLLWCSGWVSLAALIGGWNVGLLKDTLLIIFTIGFPLLFRAVQAKSGTAIMRQIGGETVALSAFLLFYLNLEPFPLWAELIFQPLFTLLVLLRLSNSLRPDGKRLQGCLDFLVTVAGLALVVWTTVQFVANAGTRDWGGTLLELALSVWLPVVMFPFFYFASFYAAAQKITRRLRRIYKPPALRRVTLAAVLGLHLRLKWARAFVPVYEKPVLRAKSFREAIGLMRDFRADVEHRQELEAERVANLDAFAGQPGTDGSGGQLDRREFEGTKRALDFLVTAQGLRYERLGNRYWDDLTELVLQPVDQYGLPPEHGVTVETTSDGQKWRAWRRMPSGWHLAIGGRNGDPGHFLYTGASSPTSWPGDGPEWADVIRDLELPEDWTRNDRSLI